MKNIRDYGLGIKRATEDWLNGLIEGLVDGDPSEKYGN